jgi:nicotinate phosphoribosyltransferase
MLTDLYQFTMMEAYFKCGNFNKRATFDLFFREKEQINFVVFAGLEQVIDYIENLQFCREDIDYLKSLNFSSDFLSYLKNFRFTGDIFSVKEGEIVFPNEPILSVSAPLIEAQFIETAILNIINHQTLIASKAARIKFAAATDTLLEFGLRRAQGPDAAIYGPRASIIGGFDATSNVMSAKLFNLSVKGTHAHSLVMSFEDELTAFRAYAKTYPDNCLLLLDTYDTLKSGIKNAITVFLELKSKGHSPYGVRLDSGDIAYLSKVVRKKLDEKNLHDVKICASGDLDEYSIMSLKSQNACVDIWGVGTKLITSEDMPSLGGVYKLCAIEKDNSMTPVIKISDNAQKITNPGEKAVYRIFVNNMAEADLICLKDETIDTSKPLTIFHPVDTWRKTEFKKFTVKKLTEKIFENGKLIYQIPELKQICEFHKRQIKGFWDEYKRLDKPHIYKVDLSQKLYDLKVQLLTAQPFLKS